MSARKREVEERSRQLRSAAVVLRVDIDGTKNDDDIEKKLR